MKTVDDKKKIAVLGVLVVVILAVGAFQFVGGAPASPPKAKKAKAAVARNAKDADGPKTVASATVEVKPDGEVRITDTSTPEMKARAAELSGDAPPPTFTQRHGSPGGPIPDAAYDRMADQAARLYEREIAPRLKKGAEDLPEDIERLVARPLPPRDPFAERSAGLAPPQPVKVASAAPPPPAAKPDPAPVRRPSPPVRPMAGDFGQAMGNAFGGMLSGMAEGLGQLAGAVPGATPGASPGAAPPRADGAAPGGTGKIPGQEGGFPFTLIGVVVGERPVAVFQSADGGQILVGVGSSIDGDSRLVAVREGQATVIHRGVSRVLKLGGS